MLGIRSALTEALSAFPLVAHAGQLPPVPLRSEVLPPTRMVRALDERDALYRNEQVPGQRHHRSGARRWQVGKELRVERVHRGVPVPVQ